MKTPTSSQEDAALLRVAGRLDKKAIKAAQVEQRKPIRAAGRVARAEMKERHAIERQELGVSIKVSLEESDSHVAAEFAQKRTDQLNDGVLAIAISAADKGLAA